MTLQTWAALYKGKAPKSFQFIKVWIEKVELARSCLTRGAKKMKKWTDKKRKLLEFEAGDLVLVKLFSHCLNALNIYARDCFKV